MLHLASSFFSRMVWRNFLYKRAVPEFEEPVFADVAQADVDPAGVHLPPGVDPRGQPGLEALVREGERLVGVLPADLVRAQVRREAHGDGAASRLGLDPGDARGEGRRIDVPDPVGEFVVLQVPDRAVHLPFRGPLPARGAEVEVAEVQRVDVVVLEPAGQVLDLVLVEGGDRTRDGQPGPPQAPAFFSAMTARIAAIVRSKLPSDPRMWSWTARGPSTEIVRESRPSRISSRYRSGFPRPLLMRLRWIG